MRKDNPNINFDELHDKVSTYITNKEDLKLITKAYLFAYEKHFGQKRHTGEDYIVHPLNVAYILADINADYQTICAALLHDTIEDCDVTKEELTLEFSLEIANLVNGVTKINKLNFSGDNEALLANHRKIIVGLTEDVRVIIIKLADRLHNMRTLWILSEKSQKSNAKETLDILVPIAHRLGMNKIKSELEDLSLRYSKPDVFFSIVEKLNQSKVERNANVELMKESLINLLNSHGIKHKIKGRAKSIYSIYKKLDTGRRFSDIYDLLALRIFVDTEQDCYQTLGLIHSKYRPIPKRFKDYIAMPKENGYQSLHTTVFGENGQLYEIQIRTYEMDRLAEHGIASHWSYKEKGKTIMQSAMEEKLQFFRSIMELSQEEDNDETFVNSVKEDVLKKIIYVFTPKGDVIELPVGATPIDFAYRVHSKVGDSMVGAIVNGNIVPLDYKLQDNDIIKINTNKASTPSKEWINMAYTAQARNKIKAFFNRIDKEENLKKGEELLTKELRRKKISSSEFFKDENIDKILDELHVGDLTELYINMGNNKFSPVSVVNIFNSEEISKEELILNKVNNNIETKINVKNDIIVEGIDEIKVNVAACCKPIPGDVIVGYITKGNGISVHRSVCPNISELDKRLIDVSWNEEIDKKYSTNILVHTLKISNNKNILIDIISKTSSSDVVIQSINTISTDDDYMFDITLLVPNKERLLKFINDLEMLDSITRVERIIK
ncbi:MAG: bifunctional (p)ppGpp synthetase/guanosine-3',5'-bis(diphosphate) 3'-pyrophosphohydrolase [Firmicutes bacterium]|nr:bifunctional (p)ppGpp synthetase/guanosine-3',5'-bis(diphosphate) 3'-pyrophosphohydrolase [Bacillota bacterium]